ncbi:Uma2 family endonuclease [Streptomyces boluensis]|uniref:Uma2 family endonuclease n=1 Tax=Streptomyces boluensis TaxID=1775135 RepID=A0A964UQZ1_9ACTN|nr:Uma2 family endonuclease [Streptomyces boluensis]NBE52861.1 Uma2 family endonuclease [Streptomyces boluensis]
MTVLEDRIEMAESANSRALDEMFEALERGPFREGYKIEVVGGAVHMVPQRNVHWQVIWKVLQALTKQFGEDVLLMTDVRIDFPGHLNGFCPDIAMFRDGAEPDDEERWRYEDIEFVGEVISRGTAANDYGPKKAVYATAGIPVYLIADPYQGRVHVYTQPKDGEYHIETNADFGQKIDLTHTPAGLTLDTSKFPRDRK